jgi:hypothetical protein
MPGIEAFRAKISEERLRQDPYALFLLDDDAADAEADYLASLAELQDEPPVLAAALAVQMATDSEIAPRRKWLALTIGEMKLRQAANYSILPPLAMGAKKRRKTTIRTPTDPIVNLLELFVASAEAGLHLHDRLAITKRFLDRKIDDGGRQQGRGRIIEAILETPVITAESIAKTSNLSPLTVRRQLAEFSSALREITGNTRFRAWAISI